MAKRSIIDREKRTPNSLKDRQPLSKAEFGRKYFGEDKVLESMAIEFLEHLENAYQLDLSGLHPTDRLVDIIGKPLEKNNKPIEPETTASMIRNALKILIEFQPLEKYLKKSNWDKTSIRYRSFESIVRELVNCKNK